MVPRDSFSRMELQKREASEMNHTSVVTFGLENKTQPLPPPLSTLMTVTFSYHLGIYLCKSTLIASC